MITGVPFIAWHDDEQEWRAKRRQGIGASEVASALGLDGAYSTPWQVWAAKTGRYERDLSDDAAVKLGNDLEPWLIDMAARELGVSVIRPAYRTYQHPRLPWLLASPDALAGIDGGRVVECKTGGLLTPWAAEEWTDQVPFRYEVQARVQMAVTGLRSRVYVPALVTGHGFRIWEVTWKAEAEDNLLHSIGQWWGEHIINDLEPAVEAGDVDVLNDVYPTREDEAFVPDELLNAYIKTSTIARDATRMFDGVKAEMKRALAGAQRGTTETGGLVTWKPDRNGKRTLRVKDRR